MGPMLYAAIDVQGRPRFTGGTGGPVEWRSVTPAYFSVLGIPILQGRGFQEEDRDPSRNVIILSDALARRMFPGESPLGRQVRPGRQGAWLTIAGVAANVKNAGLADTANPEYYVPRKEADGAAGATALIRTAASPESVANALRTALAGLDATVPVTIETMGQRIGKLAARPRFSALLITLFAALGLLLAAIGLYGVISFLVAQRAHEIGVRMALGATSRAIVRMVLRQAGTWTVAGAAAGALGSLFAVRLLEKMLFHISAGDPWNFAAAVAVLFVAALAAAWIPSRRASRLDPMQVLRRE
jgi:predicted permease